MKAIMKNIICFALCIAVLWTYEPCIAATSDNPSKWAESEVDEAIRQGLVPTDLQNGYCQNISRADFCRLSIAFLERKYDQSIDEILKSRGLSVDKMIFTDTQESSIISAYSLGIVNGVGNHLFNPDGKIKRSEAAVMLMRTAKLIGEYNALPYVYDDSVEIPTWAREGVNFTHAYEIMMGNDINEFLPSKLYTREEAYLTFLRLYRMMQNGAQKLLYLYPVSASTINGPLWGYVDSSGKFVIEPQYSYASEWNGEYGIVSIPDSSDRYFVINGKGEKIAFDNVNEGYFDDTINCNYNSSEGEKPYFIGNTLCVPQGQGYFLFSLKNKKRTSECNCFFKLSNGMINAFNELDRYVKYLDRDGQEKIDAKTRIGGDFFENRAITVDFELQKRRLIDKKGSIISEKKYKGESETFGDLMVVYRNAEKSKVYYGITRFDGTVILPCEYKTVKLTLNKQIVAQKNDNGPYQLYNESGKEIYTFPSYFNGKLLFDSIGNYLYRSGDLELVIISSDGQETAKIQIEQTSEYKFISGLIQVINSNGDCHYYDINGNIVLK